jgi:hypothetical protein
MLTKEILRECIAAYGFYIYYADLYFIVKRTDLRKHQLSTRKI